jgi:hypothetical protein
VGARFAVELDELEAVRAKLQALIQDHFEASTSPLVTVTYHTDTAADVSQTALPGQLKRFTGYDAAGSSFGPMDAGLDAAAALTEANGQVQRAIFTLLGEVNGKIADLHDRIRQTHQVYAATEQNLRRDMARVEQNVS